MNKILQSYFYTLVILMVCNILSFGQDFPIDLSKLGPGDSIVISYQAVVANDMPVDVDSVHCQVTVTAADGLISVVSDDPRTDEALDPTSVEIAIPTMGQWGVFILGLLLINIAIIGIKDETGKEHELQISKHRIV